MIMQRCKCEQRGTKGTRSLKPGTGKNTIKYLQACPECTPQAKGKAAVREMVRVRIAECNETVFFSHPWLLKIGRQRCHPLVHLVQVRPERNALLIRQGVQPGGLVIRGGLRGNNILKIAWRLHKNQALFQGQKKLRSRWCCS